MSGDRNVDSDEIESIIASQPTAKFLGTFSGIIYDYEVFDRYVLERDLQRIERYYRARGYYEARVRAARVTYKGRKAHVHIVIEEGAPVLLGRIDVHGLESLDGPTQASISRGVQSDLPLDRPLDEERFEQANTELKRRLEDLGFAYVAIRRSANVDLPSRRASVGFWVELGPKATFGAVRIEGLGPLPEAPVRRALDIRTGATYSRFELDEAKQALLGLNVFSSVSIEPDVPEDGPQDRPTQVPILVRLERSKLRSVHAGVGVQLDAQRTDVHVIGGWESSNFGGGFRRFLVEAVPGVVFYPTRLPDLERPRKLLPQLRLRSEFRQPGFIEPRTNGLVRLQGNVYPVLLGDHYNAEEPVLGYRDIRGSAGVDRSFWRLYGALTHNIQISSPFTYAGALDPDLKNILVSYPQLFLTLDLRDDRITPHRGAYFSLDTQVAGAGGDARDVKFQPEARWYFPIARKWTLATRATVGVIFAENYGRTLNPNATSQCSTDSGTCAGVSRADWVRDVQLLFIRGFFSGGPSSNRGYATRDIGPHGTVPFYNPGQSRGSSLGTNLPLGGLTLWEASIELRYPLLGPLSGVVFVDTSDVAPNKFQIRLNYPHLSAGAGLRYDTPIGPVRVDLGCRIPGLQAPPTANEAPPREIFGTPIALSFGIGETY